MEKKPSSFEKILGIAVVTGMITGFGGIVAAIFALINADWIGAGLCLLAAALAFGLLVNALLRN